MSLKYRDSQGNETPVAGLNGTSGELVPSVSLYQAGSKLSETASWAPGESGVFTVTFSTPMPDTNYDVILSIDTPEITVSVAYDKSVNGFKAKVENVSSVTYAGRIELYWTAFKLMTDESRALDETHIEQNTANFAPSFSTLTSYAVGDYVTYNNILYRCTTAHTAGVWVAGHFTQATVGGDIASISSKIPSTASSTEKLAYVEYNPDTSLYSTWEELLELLYQHGSGYWTGTVYVGKWYTYTARITIGSAGYWYGSFLAKGAESEDLVGASKTYGATTTWTISRYLTESSFAFKQLTVTNKEFDIDTRYNGTSVYEIIATQYNEVSTQPGHWIVNFVGSWGNSCQIISDSDGTNKCTFTSVDNTLHGVLTHDCQMLLYRKLV